MIVRCILSAVIAYLLGSVSTGILLSRKEGLDIRQAGSHNAGASNVLRVLGLRDGILTFVGDGVKAILAVLIGRWIAGDNGALIGGLFVVIGHNWPVFFGFIGGKGISCSTAVILMTFPLQGVIAVVLCVLVIYLTRYISLGSLTMLFVFAALLLFTAPFLWTGAWAIALFLLALYRHKDNIKRLLDGTENKIGKKVDKKA